VLGLGPREDRRLVLSRADTPAWTSAHVPPGDRTGRYKARVQRTGSRKQSGATVTRVATTAAALLVALAGLVLGSGPAQAATTVKISKIYYDSPGKDDRSARSLDAEYVVLKNTTARTQVVTGWTIRDAQKHVYTFPTTTIAAGKTVTLHTGRGTNTSTARYWKSGNYIWNNTGDTATLRNAAGAGVSTCKYTATKAGYKNC
jgi:Lamin Tail Domain